jgi:hypothetical protein
MKKSALVYSERSVQRERGKDQILHAKDGEKPIVFDSVSLLDFVSRMTMMTRVFLSGRYFTRTLMPHFKREMCAT